MGIGKVVNKVVALLLVLTFVFTNTVYSSKTKLRVPLQLQTEAGQKRAQETMDAAKPGAVDEKLASNETASRNVAAAIGDISKIRARIMHNRYQPNNTTGPQLDIDILQEIALMAEDSAVSIAAELALEGIADISSLGVGAEMAKAALLAISKARALHVIDLVETAPGAKALKIGL